LHSHDAPAIEGTKKERRSAIGETRQSCRRVARAWSNGTKTSSDEKGSTSQQAMGNECDKNGDREGHIAGEFLSYRFALSSGTVAGRDQFRDSFVTGGILVRDRPNRSHQKWKRKSMDTCKNRGKTDVKRGSPERFQKTDNRTRSKVSEIVRLKRYQE